MKIVINSCYGSFNLSPLAVKTYSKKVNQPCIFLKGGLREPYEKVDMNELEDHILWKASRVDDMERINKYYSGWHEWLSLSKEEKDAMNKEYNALFISRSEYDRHDPILVQVVEELGEKANGIRAKLKIVEIPDDANYDIDEYDGLESIHEVHHSWC